MAQEADLIVTAHLHIRIPDSTEPAQAMMDVVKQVEQILKEAASVERLDVNGVFVQVGKVIGAGVPTD